MGEVRSIECTALSSDKDQSVFIDVRTPAEYGEAHITGAVLQPLSNLDVHAVEKLAAGKDRCVLVCRSGNRARQAAEKLSGTRPNVVVLEGGVAAWEAAGLPLVRGQKAMSLERQVRIAAGSLVLLGVLVGAFIAPWGYAISAFIGAGLVFSGITDTCGMAMVIARMPWNNRNAGCTASRCAIK